MPIAILMAAFCTGLTVALIWLGLGGSALIAFALYVLTGHLAIAGLVTQTALRGLR